MGTSETNVFKILYDENLTALFQDKNFFLYNPSKKKEFMEWDHKGSRKRIIRNLLGERWWAQSAKIQKGFFLSNICQIGLR